MNVTISVPNELEELIPVAKSAWATFAAAITSNPLGDHNARFGKTDLLPGGVAEARPFFGKTNVPIHIILSERFLKTSTGDERTLTLLHECIHMMFAFGPCTERFRNADERAREAFNALHKLQVSNEQYSHQFAKTGATFRFLRLPDEILAEQYLKAKYPEWVQRRAEYYLRMRKDQAIQIATNTLPAFTAIAYFFLHLNCAFYIPIAEGMPTIQSELQKIADKALTDFKSSATRDVYNRCTVEAKKLLDVSLDCNITHADAYERIVEIVEEIPM